MQLTETFFEKKKQWFFFGILFILAGLIYSNIWQAPFQFDDYRVIVKNESLRDITDIQRIWTENGKARFLPTLSFAINYFLEGEKTFGYHLVNIGLHFLNSLWVYFLISLILRTPKMSGMYSQETAFYLASFSAFTFLVHPLQTQAVTYIVQRIASLATFFYLGAIVLYLKARSGSGNLYYGAALGMTLGAMFCKENSATLPVAIAMTELFFIPQEKNEKLKTFIQLLPFLAMLVIVPYLVHADSARHDIDQDVFMPIQVKALPRGQYFFTELNVLCTYLRLFFFPVNQNLDYNYPVAHSLMEPKTMACALVLLGFFAVGVFFLKRNRLISFSVFWFFLTLSVESSIIPIRDVIFEHRMYLPLAGCAIIFPMMIFFIFKILSRSMIAGAVIVLVFSGMTYARNNVWCSGASLWEDVIRKSPDKARGYIKLGGVYTLQKDPAKALEAYQRGFEVALRLKVKGAPIDPLFANIYNNLSLYYAKANDLDRAIELLKEAVKISPTFVVLYENLGLFYSRKGDFSQAIASWEEAIKVNPDYAPVYYRLGVLYANQGELKRAETFFRRTFEIDPRYGAAIMGLGAIALQQGDLPTALQQFEKLKKTGQADLVKTMKQWIEEKQKKETLADQISKGI